MNAATLTGALLTECERDGNVYGFPALGTIALGAYSINVYRTARFDRARLVIRGSVAATYLLGELGAALRRVAASQGVGADHLFCQAAEAIERLGAMDMIFTLSIAQSQELALALVAACTPAAKVTIRHADGL